MSEIEVKNGYYHISSNPQQYEPQRSNNFELIVSGLTNLTHVEDETIAITESDAQEVLKLSVISCDIPTFSQDPISIKYGNNTLHFAGTPSFKQGSLVVNDYIGADGKSVLMAWQKLSFNVNNWSVGRASEYKKEAYLIERDPSWRQVRCWKLFGVWITGLDNGSYSNEDNSKKTITANLSYDYATVIELSEE